MTTVIERRVAVREPTADRRSVMLCIEKKKKKKKIFSEKTFSQSYDK